MTRIMAMALMDEPTTGTLLISAFMANWLRLRGIAKRYAPNAEAAEDVLQDTLLRCLEQPPAGTITQPLGYLSRMVRNHAIDLSRRAAHETELTPQFEAQLLPRGEENPEQILTSREQLHRVMLMLTSLPPRKREAFERHRMGGESQKSIALSLGVSPTLVNFIIKEVHQRCEEIFPPQH